MAKNLKSLASKVCKAPNESDYGRIKLIAEKIKTQFSLEEEVDLLANKLGDIFNKFARELSLKNQTPRNSDRKKYLEKMGKKSEELIELIKESGNSISFGLLPDWHDRTIFNLKDDLTIFSQTCFEQKSKLTADKGGAGEKYLERIFIDSLIKLYSNIKSTKPIIYKSEYRDNGYAGEFFEFSMYVIDEFKKFTQLELNFGNKKCSIGALIYERVAIFKDPNTQKKLKQLNKKMLAGLMLLKKRMNN